MANTPFFTKAEDEALHKEIKRELIDGIIIGTVTPNVNGIPQTNGVNISENGLYFIEQDGDYGTITGVTRLDKLILLRVNDIETTPTYSTLEYILSTTGSGGGGGGGNTTVEDNLTSTSTTNALSANQGRVLNNSITTLSTNFVDAQGIDTTSWNDEGFLLEDDVVDNLTSTSTADPLSANQGLVLKGLIDALTSSLATTNSNHTSAASITASAWISALGLTNVIDGGQNIVFQTIVSSLQTVLTSSNGNISWTGQETNIYKIVLTEDSILKNPSNPITNATYQFYVEQDSSGLWTLGFGTDFKFKGGQAPSIDLNPNSKNLITCIFDGTDLLTVSVENFL